MRVVWERNNRVRIPQVLIPAWEALPMDYRLRYTLDGSRRGRGPRNAIAPCELRIRWGSPIPTNGRDKLTLRPSARRYNKLRASPLLSARPPRPARAH
jgi:hypothetical protein